MRLKLNIQYHFGESCSGMSLPTNHPVRMTIELKVNIGNISFDVSSHSELIKFALVTPSKLNFNNITFDFFRQIPNAIHLLRFSVIIFCINRNVFHSIILFVYKQMVRSP